MATLVIPFHSQVGVEMVVSGQTVMNVLGFREPILGADPAAVLAAVKTAWEAADGPLKIKSNVVSMVGYHYTNLNNADGATAYLGSGAVGGRAGNMGIISGCGVVKLSGASRNRTKNGRLFHGPIMEDDINSDGRTITSAELDRIQAAYTSFRVTMAAADFHWAVLSRKASIGTDIVASSASPIVGTQRRRLR